MDHSFKDYLEARLPGLKKQVGYWYPGTVDPKPDAELHCGTLIVPKKYMKNLALPAYPGELFSLPERHTVENGQIFLITNGKHELYFMQVSTFAKLEINRDHEFVFQDVVAKCPDNLDVLNFIHLAKVLQRR